MPIVWSTNSNPNISLSTKSSSGSGTGNFNSSLTGLNAGTKYYARAYATNSQGTAYGSEVNFTTSAGQSSGPDDIILTYIAYGKATIDCKEGSSIFEDAKGYYTKIIDPKNIAAERAQIEAQLKTQYGEGVRFNYERSFDPMKFCAIIKYHKKVPGFDCRQVIIIKGFGKTRADALENVLTTKGTEGVSAHDILAEISW